jgi:hypothetical protein
VWSSRWNDNWQGKQHYSEKSAPVPLCPPQIPHDLTWARTRAAALGSQWLTARAMTRPYLIDTGGSLSGMRRPRLEADHSPQNNAEVKKDGAIHPQERNSYWHCN